MSLKLNRKKSYICGQVRGDRYARTYNQPGEEDKKKCSCAGYSWSPPSSARWVFKRFDYFICPIYLISLLSAKYSYNQFKYNGDISVQTFLRNFFSGIAKFLSSDCLLLVEFIKEKWENYTVCVNRSLLLLELGLHSGFSYSLPLARLLLTYTFLYPATSSFV